MKTAKELNSLALQSAIDKAFDECQIAAEDGKSSIQIAYTDTTYIYDIRNFFIDNGYNIKIDNGILTFSWDEVK